MSANAAGEQVAVSPDSPSTNGLEPQFRVISIGERRRGVRLERVYWRLFDEIAAERGLKRSALLAQIIEGGDHVDENLASAVRCFVLDVVETERNALKLRADPAHIIGLMQRAPSPAFTINRQKKLQQINAEFMQLLRPESGPAGRTAEYVHLSLDTNIEELFATAKSAPEAQCGYQLQVDDRRRRGRAKLILVPGADTLVGFVLT